jgi:ankyrin repeat protein
MKNVKKKMSIILSLAIFGAAAPLQFEAGVQAVDDDNTRTENAETSLLEAAIYGHTEIVRLLLTAGENPDIPTTNIETALLMATDNGCTKIVKLLLAAGADID